MTTAERPKYWTNPSVSKFARGSDPIEVMERVAREVVLSAIQEGWKGPPYDPFQLAEYLKIPTTPREDIQDARTVPAGAQHLRIEFNPTRPRSRMRFSVAHEIAHTLFPDCGETTRNRRAGKKERNDDWQLELLCNIAAAEILMPIGTGAALQHEPVLIENILHLQDEYDVSTEAMSLRLLKVTDDPCTMFAAARTSDETSVYRVDYTRCSRSATIDIPRGLRTPEQTILSNCTAVGFTAKGREAWAAGLPELQLECVGIPPYPRQRFPRIIGIGRLVDGGHLVSPHIRYLRGDVLQTKGTGNRIIAQVVNDKTPNWGGSGFARQVKKLFPRVQDDFLEWVTHEPKSFSLGNIHLSKVSDDLQIVSMIAQRGYGPSARPRIRYSMLRQCLDQLAEIVRSTVSDVQMPRIGAGQAGGDWAIISELIDSALVRRGIEVTVYTLPGFKIEATQSQLAF